MKRNYEKMDGWVFFFLLSPCCAFRWQLGLHVTAAFIKGAEFMLRPVALPCYHSPLAFRATRPFSFVNALGPLVRSLSQPRSLMGSRVTEERNGYFADSFSTGPPCATHNTEK